MINFYKLVGHHGHFQKYQEDGSGGYETRTIGVYTDERRAYEAAFCLMSESREAEKLLRGLLDDLGKRTAGNSDLLHYTEWLYQLLWYENRDDIFAEITVVPMVMDDEGNVSERCGTGEEQEPEEEPT